MSALAELVYLLVVFHKRILVIEPEQSLERGPDHQVQDCLGL